MGGGASKDGGDTNDVSNKVVEGDDNGIKARDMSTLNFHGGTMGFMGVSVIGVFVVIIGFMFIAYSCQTRVWHCLDRRISDDEKDKRRKKFNGKDVRNLVDILEQAAAPAGDRAQSTRPDWLERGEPTVRFQRTLSDRFGGLRETRAPIWYTRRSPRNSTRPTMMDPGAWYKGKFYSMSEREPVWATRQSYSGPVRGEKNKVWMSGASADFVIPDTFARGRDEEEDEEQE